jgi:23S rRNA (adenine2030-N6)-methyltransferase
MNYRHAFHAGNFADCFKHALLVWLLQAMARKEKPFLVLDTHAGAGAYDLGGAAALRTGEAAGGILRLLDTTPTALAPYVNLVRNAGGYPGSPAIIRALLRPGDRAVLCELHPEDHAALRAFVGRDPQIAVHLRDGYEAVGAFLPPPERRGLILIDPPYESTGEFARLESTLRLAQSRFASGVVAAWYPLKHRAPVRAFHDAIRAMGLRDVVAAELLLREPTDPARLNGCGMLVVNPPFQFEAEMAPILQALLARLGHREAGEWAGTLRIADE